MPECSANAVDLCGEGGKGWLENSPCSRLFASTCPACPGEPWSVPWIRAKSSFLGSKSSLSFDDDLARGLGVCPTRQLGFLAFQAFVDGKEVLDLAQQMRKYLVAILDLLVDRIVLNYRQNFLIVFSLVHHAQQPDGADLHHAPGKAGRIHQHQDVERVAIQAERAGNKPIISGIVDGRVEGAVQAKNVKLLIIFVLVDRALGDFNHRIHTL